MDNSPKPHAVCIPAPGQGHINAMLQLAKLLRHRAGFHVTFVHTDSTRDRILSSCGPHALRGGPAFRFATIPDGLPPSVAPTDVPDICRAMRAGFAGPFRDLVRRLDAEGPPVTCIVSDVITSFTLEASAELGVPNAFFCSLSMCGYVGLIAYKQLMERGFVPLKSEDDLRNGYLDTPIEWMPGMKNMRLRDFPSFIRTTNPDDTMLNFCKDEAQDGFRATAIIVNTFDDLEGEIIDAMSPTLPPIYAIGPLNLMNRQINDSSLKAMGSSIYVEDSSCIEWLQGRAPGSVIYANFGSLAMVTTEQLVEFAWGLANSGHDFLWVIRPDIVGGESSILPKDFLEGVGSRGLLTSWCPQEEVLMHPSVGAFLTHCGWNSTMEGMSGGVPMICWPYFADQQTNCRYLCSEWGVGVELESEVKRDEVERTIREALVGEKGIEMRKMASKWKERALRATEQGGKSLENFERVVRDVLLRSKNIS